LESIALPHQIAVLKRSRTRRPCFRRFGRLFWILLSRWWLDWRESLVIVQPETVMRWRRLSADAYGSSHGPVDKRSPPHKEFVAQETFRFLNRLRARIVRIWTVQFCMKEILPIKPILTD
jgi:hypothetical protein